MRTKRCPFCNAEVIAIEMVGETEETLLDIDSHREIVIFSENKKGPMRGSYHPTYKKHACPIS